MFIGLLSSLRGGGRTVLRRRLSDGAFASVNAFHEVADETLDQLLVAFEGLDERAAVADFDIELADGVLRVQLGEHGTYVINKQAPNRQIWLSSPLSGPKRFDYERQSGRWLSTRNNVPLYSLLNDEVQQLFPGSRLLDC